MFQFYNTFVNLFSIFFLFYGGIVIFSTFLELSSITGFVFTILSAVLFPINSPVASVALWTTFLEAVFKEFSPVSNNCFLYLLEKFLANDKNPYF